MTKMVNFHIKDSSIFDLMKCANIHDRGTTKTTVKAMLIKRIGKVTLETINLAF